MNTKRKWLSALSVAALAVGLGGFIATQASATPEVDPNAGLCVIDPGQEEIGHWESVLVEDGYWESVLVTEAYDETVVLVEAQHYSLKGNSGVEKDETPLTPDEADYWQANTHQEPHLAGGGEPATFLSGTTGLHYTSHGSEGLRDWFYFQPEVTDVVHHDAVYEDVWHEPVYEDQWVIDQEYVAPTYGPCPPNVVPVPTLFNAEPDPATCFDPAIFDDGALGGTLVGEDEEYRDYVFENFSLTVDRSVSGQVTLYLYADEGFTFDGLDTTKWAVSEDGTMAFRTILLPAQLSGEEACPTDGPTPTPTPTPTDEPSPSPEPTPPNDDDAPPATPVTETPSFTG